MTTAIFSLLPAPALVVLGDWYHCPTHPTLRVLPSCGVFHSVAVRISRLPLSACHLDVARQQQQMLHQHGVTSNPSPTCDTLDRLIETGAFGRCHAACNNQTDPTTTEFSHFRLLNRPAHAIENLGINAAQIVRLRLVLLLCVNVNGCNNNNNNNSTQVDRRIARPYFSFQFFLSLGWPFIHFLPSTSPTLDLGLFTATWDQFETPRGGGAPSQLSLHGWVSFVLRGRGQRGLLDQTKVVFDSFSR
ncbi:hypothetical protein SODALDRAFT_359744 [Sodiomyces alkalinus F11]|uniref:Uncharacterized protein n=1 Tax=Sodiomyces alkalinus (strain CBS 110278 / VKM F-3762 / F11) TaxID=1314773 RepID=A0A3N2PVV3_SODAK|nr:hypothetical protein SODALDRAFT_359744 [Sodiomyces alkalinus F11]ROT38640.1 hypothetical protein SODALDRAFT_359744 [Sodiomyces alkalinus F11]